MVDYITIEDNLNKLDEKYNANITDQNLPIFLSKLSLMEFCGWIEESIDIILKSYIASKISRTDCSDFSIKVIDNNYGFKYNKNILPLFSTILGVSNWESIINDMTIRDFEQFKSTLNNFAKKRNRAAHTHIRGTTLTYDAPSTIINNYRIIKNAILHIETKVSNLCPN